ncbi:MAG: hypothetical protein H7Z10_06040 [Gemmatimonadaceae bacterium]|nr:hypothetical protein [Acetobacteraceae bacterium]
MLAGDRISEETAAACPALVRVTSPSPPVASSMRRDAPATRPAELAGIGYDGWQVIEMREQASGLATVETSVHFARRACG